MAFCGFVERPVCMCNREIFDFQFVSSSRALSAPFSNCTYRLLVDLPRRYSLYISFERTRKRVREEWNSLRTPEIDNAYQAFSIDWNSCFIWPIVVVQKPRKNAVSREAFPPVYQKMRSRKLRVFPIWKLKIPGADMVVPVTSRVDFVWHANARKAPFCMWPATRAQFVDLIHSHYSSPWRVFLYWLPWQ